MRLPLPTNRVMCVFHTVAQVCVVARCRLPGGLRSVEATLLIAMADARLLPPSPTTAQLVRGHPESTTPGLGGEGGESEDVVSS